MGNNPSSNDNIRRRRRTFNPNESASKQRRSTSANAFTRKQLASPLQFPGQQSHQPITSLQSSRIPNDQFVSDPNMNRYTFGQLQESLLYRPKDKSMVQNGRSASPIRLIHRPKKGEKVKQFPLVLNKHFDGNFIDQRTLNDISQNHLLRTLALNSSRLNASFEQSHHGSFSSRQHNHERTSSSDRFRQRRPSDHSLLKERLIGKSPQMKQNSVNWEIASAVEFIVDYRLFQGLFASNSTESLVQTSLLSFNQDLLQPFQQQQIQSAGPGIIMRHTFGPQQQDLELQIYLQFINDLESSSLASIDFLQLTEEKKKYESKSSLNPMSKLQGKASKFKKQNDITSHMNDQLENFYDQSSNFYLFQAANSDITEKQQIASPAFVPTAKLTQPLNNLPILQQQSKPESQQSLETQSQGQSSKKLIKLGQIEPSKIISANTVRPALSPESSDNKDTAINNNNSGSFYYNEQVTTNFQQPMLFHTSHSSSMMQSPRQTGEFRADQLLNESDISMLSEQRQSSQSPSFFDSENQANLQDMVHITEPENALSIDKYHVNRLNNQSPYQRGGNEIKSPSLEFPYNQRDKETSQYSYKERQLVDEMLSQVQKRSQDVPQIKPSPNGNGSNIKQQDLKVNSQKQFTSTQSVPIIFINEKSTRFSGEAEDSVFNDQQFIHQTETSHIQTNTKNYQEEQNLASEQHTPMFRDNSIPQSTEIQQAFSLGVIPGVRVLPSSSSQPSSSSYPIKPVQTPLPISKPNNLHFLPNYKYQDKGIKDFLDPPVRDPFDFQVSKKPTNSSSVLDQPQKHQAVIKVKSVTEEPLTIQSNQINQQLGIHPTKIIRGNGNQNETTQNEADSSRKEAIKGNQQSTNGAAILTPRAQGSQLLTQINNTKEGVVNSQIPVEVAFSYPATDKVNQITALGKQDVDSSVQTNKAQCRSLPTSVPSRQQLQQQTYSAQAIEDEDIERKLSEIQLIEQKIQENKHLQPVHSARGHQQSLEDTFGQFRRLDQSIRSTSFFLNQQSNISKAQPSSNTKYTQSYMNSSNFYGTQHAKKRNAQVDSYSKMLFNEQADSKVTNKNSQKQQQAQIKNKILTPSAIRRIAPHVHAPSKPISGLDVFNDFDDDERQSLTQAQVNERQQAMSSSPASQPLQNTPIEVKMNLLSFKKNKVTTLQDSLPQSQITSSNVIPISIDITQFKGNKRNDHLIKQSVRRVSSTIIQGDDRIDSSSNGSPASSRLNQPIALNRNNSESEGESILKSVTMHLMTLKGKIEKDQQKLDQNNISYQNQIASNVQMLRNYQQQNNKQVNEDEEQREIPRNNNEHHHSSSLPENNSALPKEIHWEQDHQTSQSESYIPMDSFQQLNANQLKEPFPSNQGSQQQLDKQHEKHFSSQTSLKQANQAKQHSSSTSSLTKNLQWTRNEPNEIDYNSASAFSTIPTNFNPFLKTPMRDPTTEETYDGLMKDQFESNEGEEQRTNQKSGKTFKSLIDRKNEPQRGFYENEPAARVQDFRIQSPPMIDSSLIPKQRNNEGGESRQTISSMTSSLHDGMSHQGMQSRKESLASQYGYSNKQQLSINKYSGSETNSRRQSNAHPIDERLRLQDTQNQQQTIQGYNRHNHSEIQDFYREERDEHRALESKRGSHYSDFQPDMNHPRFQGGYQADHQQNLFNDEEEDDAIYRQNSCGFDFTAFGEPEDEDDHNRNSESFENEDNPAHIKIDLKSFKKTN